MQSQDLVRYRSMPKSIMTDFYTDLMTEKILAVGEASGNGHTVLAAVVEDILTPRLRRSVRVV